MKLDPKYPMQTGGILHAWQSQNGDFKHAFLKLDLDCETDKHPGILIIADEAFQNAFAIAVDNLQKELPALAKKVSEKSVAYWWLV